MEKVEDRFKSNVGDVCQIVLNLFIMAKPRNPGLPNPKDVDLAVDAIKVLPSKPLIENFIVGVYDHLPMMETKNTENIISSAQVILPKVDTTELNMYKIIFTAKDENEKLYADEKTIETVWQRFHQMVRQSLTYLLELFGNKETTELKGRIFRKSEVSALRKKWVDMDNREKERKAKAKSP